MITLDKSKCTKCGKCIERMKNYCISEKDGYPVFDYSLCNICRKCAAICPAGAIMVNNIHPRKITAAPRLSTPIAFKMPSCFDFAQARRRRRAAVSYIPLFSTKLSFGFGKPFMRVYPLICRRRDLGSRLCHFHRLSVVGYGAMLTRGVPRRRIVF